MSDIDDIDDLFSIDPAEFVTARNQLARRLKDAGEADRAAEVVKLRKPSRTAWALNVWSRAEPAQVEDLLAAASEVAEAQRSGGQPLRDATAAYTDAVASAVEAAADRSAIEGDAMGQRLRATLLAAGADLDGPVARQLRSGALRTDADAPGFSFGAVELTSDPADGESPRREKRAPRSLRAVPDPDPEPEAAADDDEQARAAAAERARAARERKDQIRAAKREVERLRTRAERLDHRAVEAEQQAGEARRGADAAASDLQHARNRLDELTAG